MKLIETTIFYLFLLFLPTQLGKHFWPEFSIIAGLRIDYLAPTVYFTDVLIVLLFLCCVVQLFVSSKRVTLVQSIKRRVTIRAVLLCVLIAFFLLCNILLSSRILGGLYSVWKLMECMFIVMYCYGHLSTWKSLKPALLIFSIGILGESMLAIIQFILQSSVGGVLWFFGERTFSGQTPGIANASLTGQLLLRPYATFSHPNVLAGYLVTTMTLLFFCWNRFIKREQVLVGSALLIGTCGLLLTLSRAAIVIWLIVVIGTTLFLFFKHHSFSRKQRPLLISIVALFCIGLVVTPALQRLTTTSLTEDSVIERTLLLTAAGRMILSHPLMGVGVGNFLPTLIREHQPLTSHSVLQPVHSLGFLIAAETGIIGLLVFCFFLGKTYSRIKNCYPLIVVLTLSLVLGLFDHYWITIQQGQLLFSLLLGLCWGKPLCVPKSENSPKVLWV